MEKSKLEGITIFHLTLLSISGIIWQQLIIRYWMII